MSRLLAIYGYPPDLSEDATQLVLKQADLSTDAGVNKLVPCWLTKGMIDAMVGISESFPKMAG